MKSILPVFFAFMLGLCALPGACAAQDTPASPPPEPAPETVFAFALSHPDCQEWNNTCQTCVRGKDGAPACSTAGFACQPVAPACTAPKPK